MRNLEQIKELIRELLDFCEGTGTMSCPSTNCEHCAELDRIARIIEAKGD
jgi:hypothetical protein